MPSPYQPPRSDGPDQISLDGWDRASQGALIFCGVMYGILGFTMPLVLLTDEELPQAVMLAIGAFGVFLCGGIGVANFIAAWGLGQRRKWAWFATLILGGLYAPSGCMPFGLVLLYTMLRERGRKAFGI